MGANFNFSTLVADEPSVVVQTHQESQLAKVRLYPDNELYAMLEFELAVNEARRTQAKQIYKTYLESEGKYQSEVNEAAAVAIGAGVLAIIGACIALIIKLFGKNSDNMSKAIAQSKAANESLRRYNDRISNSDPHYDDEMTIKMPKITFNLSRCESNVMDLEILGKTTMMKISDSTDDVGSIPGFINGFKEEAKKIIEDNRASLNKGLYGSESSTEFQMIEKTGKAGELYNEFISGKAGDIIRLQDEILTFQRKADDVVKDLEKTKQSVRTMFGINLANSETEEWNQKLMDAYGSAINELISMYAQYGKKAMAAIKQISKVVIQFQTKFNRITPEVKKKLLGLSDAAFENTYGDMALTEADEPLHYTSVNEISGALIAGGIAAIVAAIIAVIAKLLHGDSGSSSSSSSSSNHSIDKMASSDKQAKRTDQEKRIRELESKIFDLEQDAKRNAKMTEDRRKKADEMMSFEITAKRVKNEFKTNHAIFDLTSLSRTVSDCFSRYQNMYGIVEISEFFKEEQEKMQKEKDKFIKQINDSVGRGDDGFEMEEIKLTVNELLKGNGRKRMSAHSRNSVMESIKKNTERLERQVKDIKSTLEPKEKACLNKWGENEHDRGRIESLIRGWEQVFADISNHCTKVINEIRMIIATEDHIWDVVDAKVMAATNILDPGTKWVGFNNRLQINNDSAYGTFYNVTPMNEIGAGAVGVVAVIGAMIAAVIATIMKIIKGGDGNTSATEACKSRIKKTEEMTRNAPKSSDKEGKLPEDFTIIDMNEAVGSCTKSITHVIDGILDSNKDNIQSDIYNGKISSNELDAKLEEMRSIIRGSYTDTHFESKRQALKKEVKITETSYERIYRKYLASFNLNAGAMLHDIDFLEETLDKFRKDIKSLSDKMAKYHTTIIETTNNEEKIKMGKRYLDVWQTETDAAIKEMIQFVKDILTAYNKYTSGITTICKAYGISDLAHKKEIEGHRKYFDDAAAKRHNNTSEDTVSDGDYDDYEESAIIDTEFDGLFSTGIDEATIHGEEFDGDTLYDEKDYQDFNRTDWVNLGLGEHYKDLENQGRIEEAAFKQECLYRVSPDWSFEKLLQLNEEVAQANQKASRGIIDRLKELINKFIEKLYSLFGSNKPYLDRYKKFIINGQTPAVPISSTGDIFVGMDRIMNVQVPMINYSQMAADLTDDATFFTKQCLKAFQARSSGGQWSKFKRRKDLDNYTGGEGSMSITDYCKEYFGGGNQNYKNEWQFTDFGEKDMQAIFDFLYDVKKVRDSIKKDQAIIEDSVRRIDVELKKAEKPKNQGGTGEGQTVNSGTQEGAVAYSYVYGKYLTEADFGGTSANQAASGGQGNNNPPSHISGANTAANKDTASAIKDINSTNPESTEAVRKSLTVYLNVAKAILTAKMTALEFVRKELFAIVRYKVQFNERNQQQNQATVNKAAPQQTQQQPQRGKAKPNSNGGGNAPT